MKRSILMLGTFFVFAAIHSTQAGLTVNLHNTGEGGIGAVETNYILSYATNLVDTPTAMAVNVVGDLGWGTWADPPGGSEWIAPEINYQGYWFYGLSLNSPGITSVSGKWATDNYGEIFLNGTSTGFTKDLYGFLSLTDFNITGGFTGNDTLLFRVMNQGGPTGLLITDLTASVVPGSATAIPAPSAVVLGAIGSCFLGWWVRKHR